MEVVEPMIWSANSTYNLEHGDRGTVTKVWPSSLTVKLDKGFEDTWYTSRFQKIEEPTVQEWIEELGNIEDAMDGVFDSLNDEQQLAIERAQVLIGEARRILRSAV